MRSKRGPLPRVALLAAAGVVWAGCRTPPPPSPFPELEGLLDDARVLEVLRARTAAVRSLTAVLRMTYDGPEARGTFDAITCYRAPGWMRVSAYKDLVLATENVFDLAFTPDAFEVEIAARGDAPLVREHGLAAAFAARHPRFAGFFWAREALCLPGSVAEDAVATVAPLAGGQRLEVRTTLSSGAVVRWVLDPRTLEPRSAVVDGGDGSRVHLAYSAYEAVPGGGLVPREVRYEDEATETVVVARVLELDANPPLDDGAFRLDADGGAEADGEEEEEEDEDKDEDARGAAGTGGSR